MDQFLSKLLDKYGLVRMVIAILIGFIALWGLAHFFSAPGGNVSLFWGLVQYTRNNPGSSLATPIVANPGPIARTPSQNQEASTSSVSSPVIPDDLVTKHGEFWGRS